MIEQKFAPCPRCPDGSVWTAEGPTSQVCPTCGGFAVLNINGEKLTDEQKREFGYA